MTPEERTEVTTKVFNKAQEIFGTKGEDYAGTVDVLSNFKSEALKLGLTPYQVLMVYKNKHETSILNAVKRSPERPARKGESIEESVMDSIVYNILLMCLLEEGRPGKTVKTDKLGNPL